MTHTAGTTHRVVVAEYDARIIHDTDSMLVLEIRTDPEEVDNEGRLLALMGLRVFRLGDDRLVVVLPKR